jgi:hypothetical protein
MAAHKSSAARAGLPREDLMKRYTLALLVSLIPAIVSAQTNPAAQAARVWRQHHERAIVDEFVTLLSIPDIARDRFLRTLRRRATGPKAMDLAALRPHAAQQTGCWRACLFR